MCLNSWYLLALSIDPELANLLNEEEGVLLPQNAEGWFFWSTGGSIIQPTGSDKACAQWLSSEKRRAAYGSTGGDNPANGDLLGI